MQSDSCLCAGYAMPGADIGGLPMCYGTDIGVLCYLPMRVLGEARY